MACGAFTWPAIWAFTCAVNALGLSHVQAGVLKYQAGSRVPMVIDCVFYRQPKADRSICKSPTLTDVLCASDCATRLGFPRS